MAGFLSMMRHKGEQATFNFTIFSNVANWKVLTEIGYTPTVPVVVNISVSAAVLVRDLVAGSPTQAMDLSGLPSGSTVNLTNLGYIQGQGGAGGNGVGGFYYDFSGNGNNGAAGGAAIKGPGAGRTFNVTNASGNIWGGGGGGGSGGACAHHWDTDEDLFMSTGGSGGGGGGAGGGAGGTAGIGQGDPTTKGNGTAGTAGTSGVSGTFGVGGTGFHQSIVSPPVGGGGGNGGNWGSAGLPGAQGLRHDPPGPGGTNGTGGAAGPAGKAINLNGGTVNWISGSGAPNVKGPVA